MKKWEYKVIEINLENEPGDTLTKRMENFLLRAGDLGWEMVEYIQGSFPFFILKREKVRKRGRPRKVK